MPEKIIWFAEFYNVALSNLWIDDFILSYEETQERLNFYIIEQERLVNCWYNTTDPEVLKLVESKLGEFAHKEDNLRHFIDFDVDRYLNDYNSDDNTVTQENYKDFEESQDEIEDEIIDEIKEEIEEGFINEFSHMDENIFK